MVLQVSSLGKRCCYSSLAVKSPSFKDENILRQNQDLMSLNSNFLLSTKIITRSFTSTNPARLFSKAENAIPESDPEKGQLVYVGTLSNMVKLVKGFSVSTSLIGLCVQPYLFANSGNYPLFVKIALGGTLSFFIFLTPLMLHFVTKRYVTKLYYNNDTGIFTGTTLTFFVHEKDTQFRQSDVTIPEIPGFFTTVKVNGKPLFVDPTLFLNREGYIKLMGYDKPIDWRMPSEEKKE